MCTLFLRHRDTRSSKPFRPFPLFLVLMHHIALCIHRSIDERTIVHFADSPRSLLEAYVANGEGLDRAGGFAIQVRSVPHTHKDISRLLPCLSTSVGCRRTACAQSRWRLEQRRWLSRRVVLPVPRAARRGRGRFFVDMMTTEPTSEAATSTYFVPHATRVYVHSRGRNIYSLNR